MSSEFQNISLKHGEKKTLKFTYTQDGSDLTITSAVLTLTIKENLEDSAAAMTITDGSFTKNDNIAYADLDTSSLTENKKYLCEMLSEFSSVSADKSDTFYLEIKPAVDGL